MPAAAIAIPAVIGGVTSIFAGKKQAQAAAQAGTVQANTANQTIDYTNDRLRESLDGIDTATGTASSWTQPAAQYAQDLMRPYIEGGRTSTATLQDLLVNDTGGEKFKYDPNDAANDPGMQFTLAQGMKALEQSAAARGQALSGGQQKAIAQFSQGNAATYENQFYNQALSTFNTNRDTRQQRIANLFGLSSQGLQGSEFAGNVGIQQTEFASAAEQEAARTKGTLRQNASAMVGNARTGAANSTAASILASSNANTNGIVKAGDDLGQAIFLNQIMKKPPATSDSNWNPDQALVRPGDEAQFGG